MRDSEAIERLVWIEPTVESLDVRATENSWAPGVDASAVADSAS